ncbi:Response regulator PleD [Aquisphaera giovannonii]|uniref:diguanylate cyclase n=1 Tax=Aquisphaera giovannonii TaxID=406548 RepID=A0A5B9W152_9BACT|nr:diguanylate cyclase [Aquisphaera giovannonii]QEH34283.1 Response regulator PleD [Aquisphaera giovannonii]
MEILIVDDQRFTRMTLASSLAGMGHLPHSVDSAEEAWRFLGERDVRAVITDWVMPGMSGPDLCRLIRSRVDRPYVYTILMTSLQGRENRLEGLASGADDFLSKPVDLAELGIRLSIAGRLLAVQSDLEAKNSLLRAIAGTDPLTGLANRRGLDMAVERLATRAIPTSPRSLVMLDVDHFKSFNDAYGHPAGDEALRAVAAFIRGSVRPDDLAARVGGEEFLVYLPETGGSTAGRVAERIRSAVASHRWPSRQITVSMGVATTHSASGQEDVMDLMGRADRALYASKHGGRNRVTQASDISHSACA